MIAWVLIASEFNEFSTFTRLSANPTSRMHSLARAPPVQERDHDLNNNSSRWPRRASCSNFIPYQLSLAHQNRPGGHRAKRSISHKKLHFRPLSDLHW